MKSLPELRRMATEKARRERRRYAWSYDGTAAPSGHFEILDAGCVDDAKLCDVIATTRHAWLRDALIDWLECEEYQPTRWGNR